MSIPINTNVPTSPERQLWAGVLLQAIRDLGGAGRSASCQPNHIRSWVGRRPSKDFREVCNLAGMDPDAVHLRLAKLCAKSDAELYVLTRAMMSEEYRKKVAEKAAL